MIDLGKIKTVVIAIFNDPEHFLIKKYYRSKPPKGFRIELFLAGKCKQVHNAFKKYECDNHILKGIGWGRKISDTISLKNLKRVIDFRSSAKKQETAFCRYCEKRVVPERIHKLDFGDVILFFFTAGLWAILLFFMYLFIRKCPYCNHSLRRLKPLSKGKTNDT